MNDGLFITPPWADHKYVLDFDLGLPKAEVLIWVVNRLAIREGVLDLLFVFAVESFKHPTMRYTLGITREAGT